MPRAWTIDAVYHFVTDQAGVGNAFQHQRFYTLFRLFDRATEAYRILANYGRAVDQNGGGAWSSPKHPEGELKTTDFMMKAATKLLAAGYRRRPYRPPGQHIIWMPDPDAFQGPYIYATLNSMPLEPEPGDAQAVPAPPDPSDAVSTKIVWLRTFQLKLGLMHFHTVSGDGWLIPFRDDFVGSQVTSRILVPRPPAFEKGLALARCEITPAAEGGFEVAVQELLEYHPNVFQPERCRVSQFQTP